LEFFLLRQGAAFPGIRLPRRGTRDCDAQSNNCVANAPVERGVRAIIVREAIRDYASKPWEPMLQLLVVAEYITKTHAL